MFSEADVDNFVYLEDASTDPRNYGRVGIANENYWYAVNSEGAELLYDRKKMAHKSLI